MYLSTVSWIKKGRTGVKAANTIASTTDEINILLYGRVNSKTRFKRETSKKRFFGSELNDSGLACKFKVRHHLPLQCCKP